MRWAKSSPAVIGDSTLINNAPYAVQLVRQVNHGPQESIRYFIPAINGTDFTETTEDSLVESNFEKLNSYLTTVPMGETFLLILPLRRYKNFRCHVHNKFFEVNLYQKNPTNTHHWRSTLARPSRDIDLAFRPDRVVAGPRNDIGESSAEGKKTRESASGTEDTAVFPELQTSLLPALKVYYQ
jgi:hypothetical protein